MQQMRAPFTSNMLHERMKRYDTYSPRVRSVRQLQVNGSKNSAQRTVTDTRNISGANKYTQMNGRVDTSGYAKKFQITSVLEQSRQYQLPTMQRLALYAVAHAEASHDDMLADQFVGTEPVLRPSTMSRMQKLFYGLGIVIFLFASIASIQTFLVNNEAKEQLQVLGEQTQRPDEYGVVEGTGSEPAEAEVPKAALTSYKVNPELPRYLRVPDLGIFARIKHTGIDKNGAIDSPANINDVSWYKESARPGNANGSSLLLGHVSGWTAPGIFKKLPQLKPRMRFEVEKGSGEKLAYEVTRTENIPLEQVDMAKILASVTPGEHDLKLMTCSGRYNKEKDIYEERFVVYAKILR